MDTQNQAAPDSKIQDVTPPATPTESPTPDAAAPVPEPGSQLPDAPAPAPVVVKQPKEKAPAGSKQPLFAATLAFICFVALAFVAYQAYLKTQ